MFLNYFSFLLHDRQQPGDQRCGEPLRRRVAVEIIGVLPSERILGKKPPNKKNFVIVLEKYAFNNIKRIEHDIHHFRSRR